MKKRTIKILLERKMKAWLDSVEDEAVKDVIIGNTIITGGAILSLLFGEPPNDYDVYFKTKEAAAQVASYYVRLFNERYLTPDDDGMGLSGHPEVRVLEDRVSIFVKSSGIAVAGGAKGAEYRYFEADTDAVEHERALSYVKAIEGAMREAKKLGNYQPIMMSATAITLTNDVQIIIRFSGEPAEIHENYDFVHATCYWTSWNGELVLRQSALESMVSKNLVYVGSKYPIATLVRIRKFIQRGWHISAGQLLKIAYQIHELNLDDPGVLQDQLTGVDVAYFYELLAKLKEAGGKVDKTYLMTLIDEIDEVTA